MHPMQEIVMEYGIRINRAGFCSCPFHSGDRTPSLKVYKDNYHCHACGANGDIFSWVMHMDGLTFKEAYIKLGGEAQPSFATKRKIDKAKEERRRRYREQQKAQEELKHITTLISVYRHYIKQYEPFSDAYTYTYNKLQYQLYLLEQWGDNYGTVKQSNS